MNVDFLPVVNATLNGVAAVLLLSGYIAIKRGQRELHRDLMVSALAVSTAFLVCYLFYHYHAGSKRFPDLGWIKTLYLVLLVPHIILAAAMVPMILKTFWHAWREEWDHHRKIARVTFPIWIYVSVTGVLIYFMLYVWFSPSR